MTSTTPRKVAILGGNRIPFARSNKEYANASNQDMLTSTIDGLIARFGLQDEKLGMVAAGAVLKHARDFNLTREVVLGSALSNETPAFDLQQACGTGLAAAVQVADAIALGRIDSGIAGGTDTTSDAPLAVNDELRKTLIKVNNARTTADRLKLLGSVRPSQFAPEQPQNGEPRTGLSMGDHAAITARELGISREDQDQLAVESHRSLRQRMKRASSTTWSPPTWECSGTRTCAPTPAWRNSPSSSPSSAGRTPRPTEPRPP